MDRIRVGLASFGMSGQVFHGPLLKNHSGFYVRKILKRTGSKSHAMFPEANVVSTYEAILNDPSIELVIVNTPDIYHFKMAREALERGKHVIVEKPFSVTSQEAQRLIDLAGSRDRMLTVFHNRRWDSDFLTVKQVIKSGVLGSINEFESYYDRYRPGIVLDTWKEDREKGTGVMYNLGSHLIDQVLQLFGLPEGVFAEQRICREGSSVIDYFFMYLFYQNLRVILRSSYLVFENSLKYRINGTGGTFIKRGEDPQERDLNNGVSPHSAGWGQESPDFFGTLHLPGGISRIPSVPGNYMAFYDNVFGHLRNGENLAVKPEEAMQVIRIIEQAGKSQIENRVVSVS